jgi:hypothetical protein
MGLTDRAHKLVSQRLKRSLPSSGDPRPPSACLPHDVECLAWCLSRKKYIKIVELDSSANQGRLRLAGMHWCR